MAICGASTDDTFGNMATLGFNSIMAECKNVEMEPYII